MRAIIPAGPVHNGRNYGDKKELIERRAVVAYRDGKLSTVCDARWYMARRSDGASPVYCSLWVSADGVSVAGNGKAGGYGYHKQSAALQEAIDSAGIKLVGDNYQRSPDDVTADKPARIDGCGDRAADEALRAIADALGFDTVEII